MAGFLDASGQLLRLSTRFSSPIHVILLTHRLGAIQADSRQRILLSAAASGDRPPLLILTTGVDDPDSDDRREWSESGEW
jgi:hypothetical protein